MTEFLLPDVGEGIAEAELVEWLVAVGDQVLADQPIAVVETDKSQVELPAPVAGTVAELGPAVGDVVQVGALLTRITDDAAPTQCRRALASPSVRKRALRLGLDLADVTGTGERGRVLATDLDTYADGPATPEPASDTETVVELRGLRRQVARSMTEALRIPHIHEFRQVDATALLAAKAALEPRLQRDGVRLSLLPLLVRVCAWALARHPSCNARFDAEHERITQYGSVGLGIATATDDGLVVPVLRDAGTRSLRDTVRELDRLVTAARDRTATPADLAGGTCTLTNFGSLGTWLGTPVIRPPEVAIVGFGRITEQVVAVDGAPVVRPVLPVVAATDHRVNDGAHLAALVDDLAAALEQPLLLLDET